jgi:hypothetical protein
VEEALRVEFWGWAALVFITSATVSAVVTSYMMSIGNL